MGCKTLHHVPLSTCLIFSCPLHPNTLVSYMLMTPSQIYSSRSSFFPSFEPQIHISNSVLEILIQIPKEKLKPNTTTVELMTLPPTSAPPSSQLMSPPSMRDSGHLSQPSGSYLCQPYFYL